MLYRNDCVIISVPLLSLLSLLSLLLLLRSGHGSHGRLPISPRLGPATAAVTSHVLVIRHVRAWTEYGGHIGRQITW